MKPGLPEMERILEGLQQKNVINPFNLEFPGTIDKVTEKEKFKAAKQILLGLSILYLLTITAFLIRPVEGRKLLDILTITFPPIATLILAAYFRDKNH